MEQSPATSRDGEKDLIISRVFDAPREKVFRNWTEPAHMKNWWGPENFTVPFCEVDFNVAGSFHICMRSPEGKDQWLKGFFRDIRPNERVVFTIFFSDKDGNFLAPAAYGIGPDFPAESLLTVTFADAPGNKTKLTLHYGMAESIAKRYGADKGWNESFDRFTRELVHA